MNYRELQTALKPYKEQGLTEIKLNASAAELEAELQRLTIKEEEVEIAPGEISEVEEIAIAKTENYEHLAGCKVLTLRQPWATFLARGIKQNETRSWRTSHRGKILIHAGLKKIDWSEVPELHILEKHYPDIKNWDYPLGAIVAEADLIGCRQTEAARIRIDEVERACGNWSDGRFAWAMEDVKPLFIPNVKGQLWLWTYEPEPFWTCQPEPSTVNPTPEPEQLVNVQTDNPLKDVEIPHWTEIPHWLTGKRLAQAKALCEKLGFWYVGTVENFGEHDPDLICGKAEGWIFCYPFCSNFIEARYKGTVFNVYLDDELPESEHKKLVRNAKKVIAQAGKEWGEQFGIQLDIFSALGQVRSPPPTRECA